MKRERWNNRLVFIMAAIGSAIGLGNMWRFPYVVAQNGGGAFLIPYFVALLTIGIPVIILEYGLGVFHQTSISMIFARINKKLRFFGWIIVISSFLLIVYYCVILAWILKYLISFDVTHFGKNLENSQIYFYQHVLNISKTPWDGLLQVRWFILIGLSVIWFFVWIVVKRGIKQVGQVVLYTVPIPILLLVILVFRGVTLNGASLGLNYYLSADWSKLLDIRVWLAAYGQIFFSLSVGFGVMVAYASFMDKKTEIPNSAFITSFSNCAFSFICGFAVFSILGYFAFNSAVSIETLAKSSGPALAFVVYPVALGALPFGVKIFAFLFFLMLLLLGIDSAFSLLETVTTAISDHFGFSRTKASTLVSLFGFVFAYPFVTRSGLYWLDILDHYVFNYLLSFNVIVLCVVASNFMKLDQFCNQVNQYAEIKIKKTYSFLISFFIPILLGITLILSFYAEIKNPYGDYSLPSLLIIGIFPIIMTILVSFLLGFLEDRKKKLI